MYNYYQASFSINFVNRTLISETSFLSSCISSSRCFSLFFFNRAILNANTTEIQKARLKKNKEKQRELEIQELKKDVSDIKVLLTKLIEKDA
jgi:hypothetical protein